MVGPASQLPARACFKAERNSFLLRMSLKHETWMPFYIGDYLRDTMHLDTREHGAYVLLIFAYWMRGGPLLDDDGWLSSITKLSRPEWNEVRPTLEGFFLIEENFWQHKRIDEELSKARSISSTRSAAGKAGMASRWNNKPHNKAITSTPTEPLQTDRPSPSPSPSTKKVHKESLVTEARVIIHFLNETASRSFRETPQNFKLICARLDEVKGDVDGVKRMIIRQCALWSGDPKMCEHLTPDTLFGKSNFGKYYDNRALPLPNRSKPKQDDLPYYPGCAPGETPNEHRIQPNGPG